MISGVQVVGIARVLGRDHCRLGKRWPIIPCFHQWRWVSGHYEVYDELRNCIFARFGYVFAKPKWQKQFAQQPWYRPNPALTPDKLPPWAETM